MNKQLKARVLISEISAPSLNSTQQELKTDPGLAGNVLAFTSV
jgi:hypothetical protein